MKKLPVYIGLVLLVSCFSWAQENLGANFFPGEILSRNLSETNSNIGSDILTAFQYTDRGIWTSPQFTGEAQKDYPLPSLSGSLLPKPSELAHLLMDLPKDKNSKILITGIAVGYTVQLLEKLYTDIHYIELDPQLKSINTGRFEPGTKPETLDSLKSNETDNNYDVIILQINLETIPSWIPSALNPVQGRLYFSMGGQYREGILMRLEDSHGKISIQDLGPCQFEAGDLAKP